ncbi:MAG: putative transport system permease protein [Acidobacteriota bacterium]
MNLKLALRRLVKTPFVSLVAIISLALGIGANAAIFSLFEQTLLRPLPVARPAELVNLSAPGPKPGSQSCGMAGDCEDVFSYPMFKDLERVQTVFTGVAAHVAFGVNLAYRGQTLNGGGMLVSGSYFPVLGLQPALGRLLGPDDDRTIGGHFVAVLSHDFWTTRLGANPAVLNDTMIVNGQSMTIVGVAAAGFGSTTLGMEPKIFVPISMHALMTPGWKDFDNRRSYWAYLFARLKPGTSIEQARAAMNGVYRPIVNDVEAPLQKGMSDATMSRFKARQLVVEPGARGQSSVHREARTPMLFLMAIAGIVLVIACANIANLLLARGAGRATEMAVRLSLGAGRGHLVMQLLTESCVLAVLGGTAGLVVARWTLALIASLLPPEVTGSLHFDIQRSVVFSAAGLSLATGFLFGLFPALHSTRPDLVSAIKAQAGQPSGARAAARFRSSLVTAQIALSMALLMAAGLFVKSLVNVSRVELGVRVDNVVTFGISPDLSGYDRARAMAFFERTEQELAGMPGVTGVAAASVALLAGNNWGSDVSVEGFKRDPDTDSNARYNQVSAGYFRTLGIPLMAGREFTTSDTATGPRVAIVNEAFTRKFNLGRNAVGKHIGTGEDKTKLDTEIVGVVQNAKYSDVKGTVPPLFFRPYRQAENGVGSMNFYVRAAGDPAPVLRSVPAAIARLDPTLPVEDLKTMPQQIRENIFMDRMISTLAAAFALLATVLAAIGLYGVLAYTVSQRTREIGLRMALGADGARVRGMILRQVGWMILVGGALGLGGAYLLGRGAEALLYELKGYDPAVMASSVLLLTVIAFGAGYIPAYRASCVHPMQALRYE